jgi:hypothetical protein
MQQRAIKTRNSDIDRSERDIVEVAEHRSERREAPCGSGASPEAGILPSQRTGSLEAGLESPLNCAIHLG